MLSQIPIHGAAVKKAAITAPAILLAALMLLPLLVFPTHSNAIEATTDFDAYDLLFSEQIETLDWFFDLDTAFMQYTVSTILYPWEEAEQSGWLPKRVSGEEFERVLFQHFAPTEHQLAQLRDECGYDPIGESYQVMAYSGYPSTLRPRRYMGYVKLNPETDPPSAPLTAQAGTHLATLTDLPAADSLPESLTAPVSASEPSASPPLPFTQKPVLYDVYFQTIRYRRLDSTDAEVMSALEAAGWPSTWEHEGTVYRLSTEGYVAITGYANEGRCYRVEIVSGQVRYHSCRTFTASDLPAAFDHVNQISLTLPAGLTLLGVHEAFPDKSIVAVTKVGAKAVLESVADAFPSANGSWQVYTILAPTLPASDLTASILLPSELDEEQILAFYTDESGIYRESPLTLSYDPLTQIPTASMTIPASSQMTFGFCLDLPPTESLPTESGSETVPPEPLPESGTVPPSTSPEPITRPLTPLIPATTDQRAPESSATLPGDSDPNTQLSSTADPDATSQETPKKKGCHSMLPIGGSGLLLLSAAWLMIKRKENKC